MKPIIPLVAAGSSIPAMILASLLYLRLVFGEELSLETVWAACVLGGEPDLRAMLVAAGAGAILAAVQKSVRGVPFVVLAVGLAAAAGALAGFWVTREAPHVSGRAAIQLCALSWAAVGGALSLIRAALDGRRRRRSIPLPLPTPHA
jgi:hypothetical protein